MRAVLPSGITSAWRSFRSRRTLGGLAAAFVAVTGLAWGIFSLTWPVAPVHVHVRWRAGVTEGQRVELERQFQLTDGRPIEGTSWEYQLVDASTGNIRTIVQNASVDDTAHLNRIRFRPEFAQDRARQILVYSAAVGGVGSVLFLLVFVVTGRILLLRVPSTSDVLAFLASARAAASTPDAGSGAATTERATPGRGPLVSPNYSRHLTVFVVAGFVLAVVAMVTLAGAAAGSAALALIVVYACGYLVGALLVSRVDGDFGLSWAVIRTIAGLLLTASAFLLSLVLSVPWFLAPAALVAAAVYLRGRTAFAWPHTTVRFRWDDAVAGGLVAVLLLPIAMTFFHMAPGSFPPVFYNIDTAYFLEKVHALVAATSFPPESLSNVGVRRTYHYGTQAMAALISRSSGLLPHHAVFLIVLPLLTAGVAAAAVTVARYVSPAVPRSVAVPLLLLSTPSMSNSFWSTFGPELWGAATSTGFSMETLAGDYSPWGFLSNEGQNVGGDFVVLGSVAGIAAAPSWGWTLPAFLIGSAILVKTPVGVALVAGFLLAETWRAMTRRRFWPSPQMLAALAVFTVTAVAFFLVRLESNFRVELFPLAHLTGIVEGGSLFGFALDVLWLLLPVLIVWSAGIIDPDKRSAPILLMGLAPFVVVNTTRMDNIVAGGGGTGGDWLQILHPVPFLLHAFALSFVSRRWGRLGRARRVAVVLVMAMAIVPVATVAARYSLRFAMNPEDGNEFADNRSLADALAAIPVRGSIVVTNDLRYPAQNFTRNDRQMQIPALFGHQAFAVNYAHEAVEERRPLQQLLQQSRWTEAISESARAYHWTHFLVRKDYAHPVPIPLEQVFENRDYAVFRFQ
jgi:hypothetical protein